MDSFVYGMETLERYTDMYHTAIRHFVCGLDDILGSDILQNKLNLINSIITNQLNTKQRETSNMLELQGAVTIIE
jgi:hypothetical protein